MRSHRIDTTEAIAALVSGLRFESLPRSVIARAQDLVLDHLGVALLGSTQPWAAMVRTIVLRDGGSSESTIYGYGRVPARAAALVNGTAAHSIEFDDTHDESLNHPGAVVIPAAMALAEALDRDGKAFLAAVVAGYEAQCRIGNALGVAVIERGFHPTATCGVFGAAAAAAHLLRLDAATTASAFGTAASMSSGVMQFSEDPSGTMVKRLHAGLPAERGVLAAQLAAIGFRGPSGAIEGRHGFANVFGGAAAHSDTAGIFAVTATDNAAGEQFEIERVSVKLYCCCKLFHSLVEAIGECRESTRFDVTDIVALEPFGPLAMIDTHMMYRPDSTMSAQYSLPYTVAVALMLDPADLESFEAAARGRSDLQQLSDLVAPREDEKLQAAFPRKMAGGIRITLRDGSIMSRQVVDSRSSPDRLVDAEAVEHKFRTLTARILTSDAQQRIIDAVRQLDAARPVRELASLLADIPGASMASATPA